ncbi:MAG: helix-turn-helix transcriptional regulator [Lachnospiraceae bacterium]|nr:helix-turn-helix transcriptional regulator [Lachnospiraceae bacterium]
MNYFIESAQMMTEHPLIGNTVMHSHDFYEIYLFQDGKNDYLVEGNKYRLRKGDIMLMRRGELHINTIRTNATYKRSYIYFDITPLLAELNHLSLLDMFDKRSLGEYNHYRAKDFPENHWQEYFHAICHAGTKEEKLCYLLPLLNELNKCFPSLMRAPESSEPNLVLEICKYINSDLSQSLSLEQLSDRFFISKTHINRLFKANVGTTVGQYIQLKRLFLAKELLQQGIHPTEVYSRCGFHDYTTFFRAFKKQFNYSPKELAMHSHSSPG